LDDDPNRTARARKLFDSGEAVLIADIALAETIRTLKGKRYNASRTDIVAVVMSLLQEANVMFENRRAIWSALNDFIEAKPVKTANGRKRAGFADALIANKARQTAADRRLAYSGTYTFDLAALEIKGTIEP
jgi:predicted nucleic-acid-binding protein